MGIIDLSPCDINPFTKTFNRCIYIEREGDFLKKEGNSMVKKQNNRKPIEKSYEKPSFKLPKHVQNSYDKPSFVYKEPSSPSKPKPKK